MATRLLVKAGEHDRRQCPVSIDLDPALVGVGPLQLATETGVLLPGQAEAVEGKTRLSWIVPDLPAGGQAEFAVLGGGAPAGAGVVLQEASPGQIDVCLNGSPFTSFCFGPNWSRPFLHPVVGPFGAPVTRAYPVTKDVPGETQDHPHHKSFWVAWGDLNGADNWSENAKGHAKQVVRGCPEIASGPVFGRIACTLDWVTEEGARQLEEKREMIFHNLSPSCRAVDLRVVFRACDGDIRFGDTKEGGICSIRVATSMDAGKDGTIVNSYGGTNEAETWGKRAHWCDYCGPVAERTVGIAILDHPRNFRHPTYWHVRNYGLMTANPFGLSHFLNDKQADGSHTLPGGQELAFRYRVLVHAGTTADAGIADKYNDYVNPPAVALA